MNTCPIERKYKTSLHLSTTLHKIKRISILALYLRLSASIARDCDQHLIFVALYGNDSILCQTALIARDCNKE